MLALSAARVAAAPEIITFEEMSPDGPGTGGVIPVLNFYASRGVIFRAVALDYSKGIAIPNFAHSGTKGIETCYAIEFCSAPIEMTFTQAQARVKVFAGFEPQLSAALTVVMRGFDANGAQVATVSATLAPSTSAVPIQTPLQITTATATIVRVTVGVESGGQPSFTNGLALDDIEYDTVGPPPPCPATVNPTVFINQPTAGTNVQFNQFTLQFFVFSQDPFVTTTVTDAGGAQSHSVSYPGFSGAFGPTTMNGLLVPGLSTLTVAVKDCKGQAQASVVNILFTPIATDEQFHVLGLEATQAIQNIPSSVPLVATKPTTVRVYLRVSGSTSTVNQVRGTLFAFRPANSFNDIGLPLPGKAVSLNAITVDQSDDLKKKRLKFDTSLNFDLPDDWISEGAAHFELTLDVDGSPNSPVSIPCDGCHNTLANGTAIFSRFLATPTLRLRIVGLSYIFGTNPSVLAQPRAVDLVLFQSWVQRAYPAGQFDISFSRVASSNTWQFDCDAANAQLASIRATEVSAGRDPHTHYVALVSNQGGFMRGCATDAPDDPDTSVVASSPTGDPAGSNIPANTTGDTDASFGDWYGGHELAHEFGRKHPGFCEDNSHDDDNFPNPNGQISDNFQTYVGFDNGDTVHAIARTVISPFAFDIMTYCNQPQWFSAYNYEAVLQRLNDENPAARTSFAPTPTAAGGGGGGEQARPGEAITGDFISIVASVNLTKQTGVIRHVDHVTRATAPTPPKNDMASIRFVDHAGKVIGTFPVRVQQTTDLPPGHDQTGLVQAIIPVDAAAASLELVLQGKVVSRRVITKHAPKVKLLHLTEHHLPHAGESARYLTWIGLDLDGGPLTYLVQISSEGAGAGETWDTLATGLTEKKLALTDDQLKGDHRRLRVIANDGFNVSEPAVIEVKPAER
jgi:hypothetical protein